MEGAALMSGAGKWLQLIVASAGVALLLGLITTLGYVHNLRWDFSPGSRFTLSDHGKQVLRDVEEPLRITGFIRTGDGRNVVLKDLLWQASKENPLITYTIVDVNRNPTLAAKLGVDAYGASVIESATRRSEFSLPTEQSLVSAVIHVTRPPKKVMAVTGHGECGLQDTNRRDGCSLLRVALSRELYKVSELNLLGGKPVPEDCDVLMIVGPQREFTTSEIDSVDAYVRAGGRLLALVDPFSSPRLAALLARHGIELSDDVVLDADNRLSGGEAFTAAIPIRNDRHLVTVNLDSLPLFSAYRSVRASVDEDSGDTAVWLLKSGPESWGSYDPEILRGKRPRFVAGRDVNGPLTVAVEVVKPFGKEARSDAARIIVFGDSGFVTNRFLDYLGNRDLLLNTVNWLAREDRLIAPRAKEKEPGVSVFFVSDAERQMLLRNAVVYPPVFFLLAGVVIFAWRRWSA